MRKLWFFVGLVLFEFTALPDARAQVTFSQPPTYAGAGKLFVADFNGDGKPDLLSGSDGVMQLGNGDGTFRTGTAVTSNSASVLPVEAVADFDGDGRPDVLQAGNGTLMVLKGNGDGTFQTPVVTASGAELTVLIAVDLNGDGKADVAGFFAGQLLVYLSKGDGSFAPAAPYTLPSGLAGLLLLNAGDFNGDGKADLVLSVLNTMGISEELVLLGNGDGTLQAPIASASVASATGAVTGDFNGDGKTDLALFVNTVPGTAQGSIYVLPGDGDGTFRLPVLAASDSVATAAAADLNGDGKTDLIAQPAGNAARVYLGQADATLTHTVDYVPSFLQPPNEGEGIAIADFNGDGKLDVAVGNAILLGNGDGTFKGVAAAAIPNGAESAGFLSVAAAGVFDKTQNAPGVAVSSFGFVGTTPTYQINLYRNDGTGQLTATHSYVIANEPVQVVARDFNGDGNLDLLVVGMGDTWGYSVLLGHGDGSFDAPILTTTSVQPAGASMAVTVGDFNGNGKLDFAVGGLNNESMAVLLGNGDGTFGAPSYVFDGGDRNLVTEDFNGDGKMDIAAGLAVDLGTGMTGTALLFGNGDGTFQPAVFPANLSNVGTVFTADFNNDGKPDLLGHQVALGNGDGTFTVVPGTFLTADALGDFNGDGILDLYTADSAPFVGLLSAVQLGNGDGTFGSKPIDIPSSGFADPVAVIDMNGDGRPDIVFVNQSGFRSVGVLLNTTAPDFGVMSNALSPTTVTAGGMSTATIHVNRGFGFSGTIGLTCSGLPGGASCAFSPASLASGSSSATLTISTTADMAAGIYAVQVVGTAGTLVHQTTLMLTVQAAPDFAITPPATTSQTVMAGQGAMFTLSLAPANGFAGMVSLSCAITPMATPAPTCGLSSSSIQISGTASQTVMVTVGTAAPMTSAAARKISRGGLFPVAWLPLLGLGGLLLRKRKRLPLFLVLLAAFGLTASGCSGGSNNSMPQQQTTPGTPAGMYTAAVTATSGGLTHTTMLQVTVQ